MLSTYHKSVKAIWKSFLNYLEKNARSAPKCNLFSFWVSYSPIFEFMQDSRLCKHIFISFVEIGITFSELEYKLTLSKSTPEPQLSKGSNKLDQKNKYIVYDL